jgi:streptogramin lyase
MKKVIILLLSLISIQLSMAQIGSWRNYLSYHDIQQIQAAGNDLFVLASNGLYQYNRQDHSIYTYDKTKGLSDVYINHIKWCQQAKRLIAVYSNSNIDLVETNGNVTNISDIYTKSITGDKTINSLTINGQYAYLACGFGIVKLDVKNTEISESYMLNFSVTAIAFEGNNIYAKSKSNAVWTAHLSNNLIDPNNWQQTTTYPSFAEDLTDYNTYIEEVKTLNPGGPKYNYFGFLKFANNQLYSCGGETNGQTIPACIQILRNGEWQQYEEGVSEKTGYSYVNITCLDYDPNDVNHVFAGARNGLYEFRNGAFVNFYNSNNSPIEAYNGKSLNYQLVTGVKFDNNGTLWILNSQAPTQSVIKYANGTFTSVPKSELMKLSDGGINNKSNGNLSQMMTDSQGAVWFTNNHWALPAFYQFNTSNNSLKVYDHLVNQDGVVIELQGGITCIAEDLDHHIWIGTNAGPFMLERSKMDETNPSLTQVKVPRNDGTNYADYLLAGSLITSIAVDAGGRKWFGTRDNGAYLISADNMTQLQHFTVENSNLLSNNIMSVVINNESGEVFFGTDQGLCSYMSDATTTYSEMSKDNVWAYPNPVSPDYTGLITIVGLTYNADVKILSSNGALIAEGRSNGGTFTWDGCDQSGNRVASGVYMVATATADGSKGTVCKIAIVN